MKIHHRFVGGSELLHSGVVPSSATTKIFLVVEQENTTLCYQLLAATQRRMDSEMVNDTLARQREAEAAWRRVTEPGPAREQTILDVLPADHAMWTCTRCGSLSDIPANKLSKAIANHHHHTGPAEKHVYDAEEPHND